MTEKVVLASESLFQPANGERSTHSLVKIRNSNRRVFSMKEFCLHINIFYSTTVITGPEGLIQSHEKETGANPIKLFTPYFEFKLLFMDCKI